MIAVAQIIAMLAARTVVSVVVGAVTVKVMKQVTEWLTQRKEVAYQKKD